MSNYSVTISDDYVVPEGQLTKEQYVEFVLNKAAESYMKSYKTDDVISGVQVACDVHNASIVEEEPVE